MKAKSLITLLIILTQSISYSAFAGATIVPGTIWINDAGKVCFSDLFVTALIKTSKSFTYYNVSGVAGVYYCGSSWSFGGLSSATTTYSSTTPLESYTVLTDAYDKVSAAQKYTVVKRTTETQAYSPSYSPSAMKTNYLSTIGISCPFTVKSNSNGVCTSTAYYSDSTNKQLTLTSWASNNSNVLSINSTGAFTTGKVSKDTSVTITGTYKENVNSTVPPFQQSTTILVKAPTPKTFAQNLFASANAKKTGSSCEDKTIQVCLDSGCELDKTGNHSQGYTENRRRFDNPGGGKGIFKQAIVQQNGKTCVEIGVQVCAKNALFSKNRKDAAYDGAWTLYGLCN